MVILVRRCYLRKDGTFNEVIFDTERKEYCDNFIAGLNFSDMKNHSYVFIEAKITSDVNQLRERLIKEGYKKVRINRWGNDNGK